MRRPSARRETAGNRGYALLHRIGLKAGLTCRKQADMQAALEVTRGFRIIAPEDPVRYDFALTRLGIRDISLETRGYGDRGTPGNT
jgi:hypothetical protein